VLTDTKMARHCNSDAPFSVKSDKAAKTLRDLPNFAI
jgi:hypothetical protein